MGIQSDNALNEAYKLIEVCNTQEAEFLLNDAAPMNLESTDIFFAIQSCRFWNPVWEQMGFLSFFEKGELLLNKWKRFLDMVSKEINPLEKTLYAFRKGVFSLALEFFSKANDENDARLKSEILRKTGLCYKKLGSYEVALRYLTEANGALSGQASVLAEMADCYALCGETKNAKMLFREAFYIDPEEIDLAFLDSPLIRVLVDKVSGLGYSGNLLQQWIPVYGVLYGVFNVKRNLRSQEALRLKQEIYARENELKDPANQAALIEPRLLNLYFWMIDFHELSKSGVSEINEVMMRIQILNKQVYEQFVK